MAHHRPSGERPIYQGGLTPCGRLGPAWGTGCSYQPASSHIRRAPFTICELRGFYLKFEYRAAGNHIVLSEVPELDQ